MANPQRYAAAPESIRAYRLRVWSYCEDLQRETDPLIRANTALYLAEAAATLTPTPTEVKPPQTQEQDYGPIR